MSLEHISVAIPTYKSSKYLNRLLEKIEKINLVNEIIISNDFSDKSEEKNLEVITNKFVKRNPDKNLVFLKNKNRLGPFVNKYKAISQCRNEIVYQIDSDNLPMIKFDNFFNENLYKEFNKENIYYPSKIYQFRTYEKFCMLGSKFSNKYKVTLSKEHNIFSKETIQEYIKNNEKIDSNKSIRWLLNIGNFIVYKNNFLDSMQEGLSYDEKYLFAADQFLITYLWLKNRNSIELHDKHYHFHRKRNDSISFSEKERTSESFEYIERKILNLT